jgi:hypothetical protein
MIEKYTNWIIKWKYLVVLIAIVLSFTAISGLRFSTFSNDHRIYFSEENEQLNAFEELQATYTKNDNVIIVLAPKDGKVFTPQFLDLVENITQEAWLIPYSGRVDSITNFQHISAAGDELAVDDIVRQAKTLTGEQIEKVRKIVLKEPLLLRRLISPAGDVTAINVVVRLPGHNRVTEVPEVVNNVRALVDRVKSSHKDVDVYLTGVIMNDDAFSGSAQKDMSTLIPLMLILLTVVLGILLRTILGTCYTLLIVFLSSLSAMGLAGWFGIILSPPSASAPNIIMTLAVADCVHILVSIIHGMRAGLSKQEAIVESMKMNFRPVFLTSLTTALGFVSMNFSDAPPFRDLANISAMGVVIAFALSVSLLPALLAIVPLRIRKHKESRTESTLDKLAGMVIERRTPIFWAIMLMILLLIPFTMKNELNDEFVKYFDETVDFRVATDFTTERLTGLYFIDYSLESGEANGINDPAYMQRVEAFAQWYAQQPETLHVNSIPLILKRINQAMHGDDEKWYALPTDRSTIAQYLQFYEMSLPYGLDLNDRLDTAKSATRMSATLRNLSSKQLINLEQRAQEWLAANAPEFSRAEGSSTSLMFAHIGQRNIKSMLWGTLLAFCTVFLTLTIALRSVRIGLLSLAPNILPAALAFGLWGILYSQVGVALSVVTAMTLGIVVDDTVHFLNRFLKARNEKRMSTEDAIRWTFSSVGGAIWTTSLVLIIGFSTLAFSSFKPNSDMGISTAIVIGMALLIDLFFLPPLILKAKEFIK